MLQNLNVTDRCLWEMFNRKLLFYKPIKKLETSDDHDDVIKWKHFPPYWAFVRGIHRWPGNSPYKGQWRGALMFSLICAWINRWVNNRGADDLRRHRAHYNVTVMSNELQGLANRLFRCRSKNHQSSAPLACVRETHRRSVDSPHKGPVRRKMFPFGDVIMNGAIVTSKLLYLCRWFYANMEFPEAEPFTSHVDFPHKGPVTGNFDIYFVTSIWTTSKWNVSVTSS